MKKFAIITDSGSDLNKEIRERFSIDYVQMNLIVEGKEIPASLDWEQLPATEMYNLLKAGTIIKTTQVPPTAYESAFSKYLEKSQDVLYVGISSALSGSVNTAKVIAEELAAKYENKVYCVDVLNSCMGEGLMAVKAAMMRDEGKSVQEVVEYLEIEKLKYLQICTVGDLTYLKRAGRVKASSAFFGNLFGVKPILISNRAGENFAIKKVKGRKNSLAEIVNLTKENIVNPSEQIIAVMHADCIEDAQYVADRIKNELNPKEIYINYIGPIIGSSAGPDTVAIYCKGKEVEV